MTEIDDSLTAMDWLVNPAIDLLSGLKINAFLFDQVSQSETRDYMRGNIKSEPTHPDKPPYSYAELIKKAIESSPQHKMTLNEIYEWICRNFPYYRDGQNGWKNSIRHNLSLNRSFRKIARRPNEPGRGSFWRIIGDKNKFKPPIFTKTQQVSPLKTTKCKAPIPRNSPIQSKASTSEPSGSIPGNLCNAPFGVGSNFSNSFSEEQPDDKLTIMGSRATSEAAQLRKLNSTFQQLADNLFPRSTGLNLPCIATLSTANLGVSSNFFAQSTDPETDLLKSRLHKNLWIASFFDWSAVDQSGIETTTNLLSRLEHFTAEASTLELLNLNDCLETLFHGKSSTTGDFDSSSSSPQILPGIQDSFGPCAPKDLDAMGGPTSKVGDIYNRPTSWVQSILQQEDDHPKDEEAAYHHRVTSYFEPISLEETLQLPPINDLQRREEFRGPHVTPPPLYHTDVDLVSTEIIGYGANWSTTSAQRNTFNWEAIH